MAMNDLPRDEPLTIWTIGHSTRPVAELVELLRQAEVTLLVDIRSVPRSRTNPQFNREVLPPALAAAGIAYRHLSAVCAVAKRGCAHQTYCGAARRFATMPIMPPQAPIFAPVCGSSSTSPLTAAARSCAPRRCGGAAIAASSATI